MELTPQSILHTIKETADQLLTEQPDLPPDEVWALAVGRVTRLLAEEQEVSPFEARILAAVEELQGDNEFEGVPTTRLAAYLGVQNPWVMWYHCNRLKRRGLLYLPGTGRRGWRRVRLSNESNEMLIQP